MLWRDGMLLQIFEKMIELFCGLIYSLKKMEKDSKMNLMA